MPSLSIIAAMLAALLPLCRAASAEPYLAVRTGMRCSACHTNMTGAGHRTEFGTVYSQTYLPARVRAAAGRSAYFSGMLEDLVAVGADVRLANQSTFGEGRRPAAQRRWDNTFAVTEAQLYGRLTVVPDALTLYLDEQVAPGGASSREALILLQGLPAQGYLKAGRLLLPYGWRLWDDQAAIRRRTGFNFDNQDLGVELGFEPGPLALAAAVSNGTQGGVDNNRGKMVSATASLVTRRVTTGVSFARNRAVDATAYLYGAHVGIGLGRFGWMGEVDIVEERGADLEPHQVAAGDQLMLYTALDVLMHRGVTLRLAYDYYDPYRELGHDVQDAITIGAMYFPMQFLQVRALYRRRDGILQLPQEREDELLLEIHTFL